MIVPQKTTYSLRQGDSGIVAWALQKALGIAADGAFGPVTKQAVTDWQVKHGLTADGIAGPVTQRSIIRSVIASRVTKLPKGLLDGFAAAEGGWLLGAVNWSVSGGVDCGVFQRRVYEADYHDEAVVKRAFDVAYQAGLLQASLVERHDTFVLRTGTHDGYGGLDANEKAWRLAALHHNYPSGADTLSRTPVKSLSFYWTSPQSWVIAVGAKFPDGVPVRTPLGWCHNYSGVLGLYHGSTGNVTARVTDWTP